MFSLESNSRYFMCQHPVSMRKGIDNQSATIKSLELTIKNLEEQLLKKEDVLASAEAQKKALGKLLEKKNEKVKTSFVPKTQEEKDAALPPKQPHEVYRNLLPDRWSL